MNGPSVVGKWRMAMNGWLLSLLASLTLTCGVAAEDGGTAPGWRKMGQEEIKTVLKDVGLDLRDKPSYPKVAYRLYPKPYEVSELATVGYSPFETEDGSPLNGANPDDARNWGPSGEPVAILRKPGAVLLMEGFFSRKRVPVEINRYTYRYSKIRNHREDPGETHPDLDIFLEPKDFASDFLSLFTSPHRGEGIAAHLSRFVTPSAKDGAIADLLREIESFPSPFGESPRKEGELGYCDPLEWSIARRTTSDREHQDWREKKRFWAKTIARYYPPGQASPMGRFPWCTQRTPLVSWRDGDRGGPHGDESQPHLLPDGTILVKLGTNAVIRLRWEDGEPVGPLPPFLKVIDEREVIWAKLDLLRRYRDELRRRGLTNADVLKLRTPGQIMHDLAAYFFDIRTIGN